MPPTETTEPTDVAEPTEPVAEPPEPVEPARSKNDPPRFTSMEQFGERMRKSHLAKLKKAGIDGEEGLAALQEELATHREAQEKARQDALSEQEKRDERIKELEAAGREKDEELTAHQVKLAQAEFNETVINTSGKLGIVNYKYAGYLVGEAAEQSGLEDGEAFDELAFLKEALEDPTQRAALMGAPKAAKEITTSPDPDNKPEPPPKKAPGGAVDFMKRGKDGSSQSDMDNYIGGLNRN